MSPVKGRVSRRGVAWSHEVFAKAVAELATGTREMGYAEAARIIGNISPKQVKRWALGHSRPKSDDEVARIAEAMELDVARLRGAVWLADEGLAPQALVAERRRAPYIRDPAEMGSRPEHMDPEVWGVVQDAIVRAYEKMVQRNELAGRSDGLERAIEMINMLIYALNEMGEDTSDLSRAAIWLHKRRRGDQTRDQSKGLDEPESP